MWNIVAQNSTLSVYFITWLRKRVTVKPIDPILRCGKNDSKINQDDFPILSVTSQCSQKVMVLRVVIWWSEDAIFLSLLRLCPFVTLTSHRLAALLQGLFENTESTVESSFSSTETKTHKISQKCSEIDTNQSRICIRKITFQLVSSRSFLYLIPRLKFLCIFIYV